MSEVNELRDLIAGYLSTIGFRPAEHYPGDMRPWADGVLKIAAEYDPYASDDDMRWYPELEEEPEIDGGTPEHG